MSNFLNTARSIYNRLKDRPLDPDKDPIKQIHNILDFVGVYIDIKPAFFCGDDDVESHAMELFISLAKENDLRIKLTPCRRNYGFLNSILTIPLDIKEKYIHYRQEIDSHTTGLWVYKKEKIADSITQATHGKLDYGNVLGYPGCCISENEKVLAKMHEFFIHHYINTYKEKNPDKLIDLMDNPEISQPDVNMLNKPFHKMRLNQYPYISHTPCSTCLASSNSPSDIINQQRKELAQLLDTGIDSFLQEFVKYYNQANP
jgi:hypothetical protein